MKKIIVLIVGVAMCFFVASLSAAKDPTGLLEEADTILPTAYRIKLSLNREVPKQQIGKQTFVIREKDTNEKVKIVSIRRFGAADADHPDLITGVMLDADLNPTQSYLVEISFPDGQLKTIEVGPNGKKDGDKNDGGDKNAADKRPPIKPLINIGQRFLHIEVQPFIADGDTSVGIKYDVKYNVKNAYIRSGLLSLDFQSHGEFSLTRNDDVKIQNSLNGGVNATYLYNVPAAIPLGDETRTYVYPMGFKVAPAEFEMNRSFSLINYSAKVLVGGAIPYADYPSLLWSKWFNLQVPFTAPTIFTGFAFLKGVKDDGSDNLSRLGRERWDTEFLYDLPLHNRLDLRFAWHAYVGLENSFYENNSEVSLLFYTDEKRTQGFVASYSNGALPPEFKRTSSWRIGYMAKF